MRSASSGSMVRCAGIWHWSCCALSSKSGWMSMALWRASWPRSVNRRCRRSSWTAASERSRRSVTRRLSRMTSSCMAKRRSGVGSVTPVVMFSRVPCRTASGVRSSCVMLAKKSRCACSFCESFAAIRLKTVASWPTSSREPTGTRWLKWPRSTAAAAFVRRRSGLVMPAARTEVMMSPIRMKKRPTHQSDWWTEWMNIVSAGPWSMTAKCRAM